MRWKDIYEKSNHTEYSQLIELNEPVKLEGNFSKFFSEHKIFIIIFVILFVVLSFATYKLDLKTFFAIAFVICIVIMFLLYYNSYKLSIRKNILTLKAQLNDIKVDCDNLVTIYLSKKKVFLFIIIPINVYYINIIYEKENSKNTKFNIITLPTIMNKKEDVYKFFKHFKFNQIPKNSMRN